MNIPTFIGPWTRRAMWAGLLLIAVACGGASTTAESAAPSSPPASPVSIGTVTLTDEGCTLDVSPPMPNSGFTIAAVNETAHDAGFDLYLLHDETTFDTWVDYHEAAQASIDSGGEGPGDPTAIADPIDLQVAVDAGASGLLTAGSAEPGSYALQCWLFPESGARTLRVAGPIDVSSP